MKVAEWNKRWSHPPPAVLWIVSVCEESPYTKKKKNLRTHFVLCVWCFEQRHFSSVMLLVGVYRCFSMNVSAYFSNTICKSLDVFCNKGSSGKSRKMHRKRLMLESLFNKIVGCKFQHRGFFLWILRKFLEDLFTGKTYMENFWVTASGIILILNVSTKWKLL